MKDDSIKEYEVEAIVGSMQDEVGTIYCVKWVGFDEATWEPYANLKNCMDMVIDYHKEFPTALMPHTHEVFGRARHFIKKSGEELDATSDKVKKDDIWVNLNKELKMIYGLTIANLPGGLDVEEAIEGQTVKMGEDLRNTKLSVNVNWDPDPESDDDPSLTNEEFEIARQEWLSYEPFRIGAFHNKPIETQRYWLDRAKKRSGDLWPHEKYADDENKTSKCCGSYAVTAACIPPKMICGQCGNNWEAGGERAP